MCGIFVWCMRGHLCVCVHVWSPVCVCMWMPEVSVHYLPLVWSILFIETVFHWPGLAGLTRLWLSWLASELWGSSVSALRGVLPYPDFCMVFGGYKLNSSYLHFIYWAIYIVPSPTHLSLSQALARLPQVHSAAPGCSQAFNFPASVSWDDRCQPPHLAGELSFWFSKTKAFFKMSWPEGANTAT